MGNRSQFTIRSEIWRRSLKQNISPTSRLVTFKMKTIFQQDFVKYNVLAKLVVMVKCYHHLVIIHLVRTQTISGKLHVQLQKTTN